jgi:YHS domain-containing protein
VSKYDKMRIRAMKLVPAALVTAVSVVAAAVMGTPTAALAKDPVNTDVSGLAVKGYDPVAYFTEAKPIKGKAEFEYQWQGVKWRFSSAQHLELFKATPDKYAAQYGGY